MLDIAESNAPFLEAIIDCVMRKPRVVLFPGKSFFLCRSHYAAVPH
jgi:hypothetical protein